MTKKKLSCVRNLFILIPPGYLSISQDSTFVAPASGELYSIYFRDLKDETSTSNILGKNIPVTQPVSIFEPKNLENISNFEG